LSTFPQFTTTVVLQVSLAQKAQQLALQQALPPAAIP
jgi:hypothetical protein